MKYLIMFITILMFSCTEEDIIDIQARNNYINSYVLLNTSHNLKYIDSISFLDDRIIGDELRKSIKFYVDTSYYIVNYNTKPELDSLHIVSELNSGFIKYLVTDNNSNILLGEIFIIGKINNPSIQAEGFIDNQFFKLVYFSNE